MKKQWFATIEPHAIYGENWEELSVFDSYEIVSFREPTDGDFYLGKSGLAHKCDEEWIRKGDPRLILRKKPKPRRWVVEEINAIEWKNRGENCLDRGDLRVKGTAWASNDVHYIRIVEELPA